MNVWHPSRFYARFQTTRTVAISLVVLVAASLFVLGTHLFWFNALAHSIGDVPALVLFFGVLVGATLVETVLVGWLVVLVAIGSRQNPRQVHQ